MTERAREPPAHALGRVQPSEAGKFRGFVTNFCHLVMSNYVDDPSSNTHARGRARYCIRQSARAVDVHSCMMLP